MTTLRVDVADVQVTVQGTKLGSVTNANGQYTIVNVPPGSRSVVTRPRAWRSAIVGMSRPAAQAPRSAVTSSSCSSPSH